jgi:hypothetical protein
LNDFLIRDHKNDTLIYFNSFYLSPASLGKILSADFNFSSLSLEGVNLNIYKYLKDDQTNLEIFFNKISIEDKYYKIK